MLLNVIIAKASWSRDKNKNQANAELLKDAT